jgi:hypothetical protein
LPERSKTCWTNLWALFCCALLSLFSSGASASTGTVKVGFFSD